MNRLALVGLFLVACGGEAPVTVDPLEASDGKSDSLSATLPQVRCSGSPAAGARASWRHWKSRLIALGAPKHRGIDAVAAAVAGVQVLSGELSYGLTDKALEDEQVDLFACRAGQWRRAGSAISDGEGRFQLGLTGSARLPIGLRDMFLSVAGDRTGVRFALVAPDSTRLLVSDVDGTLTESEGAYPTSLLTGEEVGAHPDAAAALAALKARGYVPVYLSSRGRVFTGDTRDWLAANGFPRGILRLAAAPVTLPGAAAVRFKADEMFALSVAGMDVALGLGNRASDGQAYQLSGIGGERVFLLRGEYDGELEPLFDDGSATPIDSYADLALMAPAL